VASYSYVLHKLNVQLLQCISHIVDQLSYLCVVYNSSLHVFIIP